MIIAAVDDLLFASRIRQAARDIGVDVVFARTPAAVVDEVRERRPALLVLDLNADRLRPLDAIAAVKGDPQLAMTRVVGYVSHVDAPRIAAARAAGADQVLARSAFVAALGELLAAGRRE